VTWLSQLFSSGHAVDLVLIVMGAEFAFLTFPRRRFGRGRSPVIDRILVFAPGVFILLALRAALTGAGWVWIAVALAASFPFHIADLVRRKL
jgi:hypothetical protein